MNPGAMAWGFERLRKVNAELFKPAKAARKGPGRKR
jgi:hypothetical protein